jgi:nucleoside-diphosphate-sugar epimerase
LDIGKAEALFGWKPGVSLDDGIADTIRWWRANPPT